MHDKTYISVFLLLFNVQAHAESCIPTAHRTTGTHYEPVKIQKIDVSTGVIVKGQVLAMPDCRPVANAKVAHWQAGENGRYQDKLRAYLFTDKQGRFQFETEWPNISPPHIHFIVSAKGYKMLETQWIGVQRKNEIQFDVIIGND